MDLVSSYLKGEIQKVWRQINLIDLKSENIETIQEVEATLDLVMKRIRGNIESIIFNLSQIGYEFQFEQKKSSNLITRFSPATTDVNLQILKFEEEFGHFPLTLKSFYFNIETVCLMGNYPESWGGLSGGDPLVIWPLESVLDDFYAENLTNKAGKQIFEISISPCFLAKEGTSGGGPYCVDLPSNSIDFFLKYERHHFNFIDYLRRAFFWGGFPGFDFEEDTPPISDIQFLKKDLVDF